MSQQQNVAAGNTVDEPLWSENSNVGRAGNDGETVSQTHVEMGVQAHSDPRNDNSNQGDGATAAIASGSQLPTEDEQSIMDIVDSAVIKLDESCSNLPLLRPQELKIIGRCVTFVGETIVNGERVLLHYEGLVSMITKDTVVLLYTSRYTEEDFAKLQERRRKEDEETAKGIKERLGKKKKNHAGGQEEHVVDTTSGRAHDTIGEENCMDCFVIDGQSDIREFSSLCSTHTSRHGRQLGTGSMAPVPYMTYSRRRIHKVEFARDPRSTFYSLFRDPTRYHFDMQCLRMFVRRYLVHTSQGSNPRNIPLRPFIACRCNCKDIDDNLLLSVAKEELAHLLKAERGIVKLAERTAQNRRNGFHAYRAPHGLFRATGVLFLTKIPVQTFCLAILQILLTLLLLSFSAYSFAVAPPLVIYGYVKNYTFYVTVTSIASLLTGAITASHSLKMRLPLSFSVVAILRFVSVSMSIGLNMMMVVMAGEAVSFAHIREYLINLAENSHDLCTYYYINNCSGFLENCDPKTTSPLCMRSQCHINPYETCTLPISSSFTRTFVPMVVLSMVLIALFLIDHFLHYRLVQVSRLLLAQL